MNRFELAMLDAGIPRNTIDLVTLSPTWIQRFKTYKSTDIDQLIYFFPKIFITLNKQDPTGLLQCTESEMKHAKKNHVQMDIS